MQGTPQPETRYRVHHSYIWLGSLGAIIAVFFVLVVTSGGSFLSLLAGDGEDALVAAISMASVGFGMIIISAVIVLSRFLSYRHLCFTIGQDEFNLYSGIFSKQRVHIPYARIQSVDQHATLLQRIFGVCTVSIDTAGGAANKAVQIPYLTKQQAEWLRSQLFARKQQTEQAQAGVAPAASTATAAAAAGQPAQTGNVLDAGKQVWDEVGGVFAGSYQEAQPVSYEFGLSNKELILAGLSNNTAFAAIVMGIICAAAEVLSLFADQIPTQSDLIYDSVSTATIGTILSESILWLSGLIVGIMVFIWILSGIASCVSYGGFRARRRGPRIEVERGLLQHMLQGVNIDRVQAVVIKQTFIRRLLGYCELTLSRVDAAGEADASSQSNGQGQLGVVIHPFLKLSRVNEVLAGLVPEYKGVPQDPIALSPKALRRGVIRRAIWQGGGFWCAVCAAILQVLLHTLIPLDHEMSAEAVSNVLALTDVIFAIIYLLALILFVFDAVGAVMWARGSSFAYNRRFMQVTNAGLTRETVNFPRQKIQFGCVRTNPLQRLAKTATIQARTAAGIGGTNITLIDTTAEDADAWLSWLEPVHNR